MKTLETTLSSVIRDVFDVELTPEFTRPDEQFGDYATNVAMQLAGRVRRNPREVAETLVQKLRETLGEDVKNITIAGPGFINLTLSDAAMYAQAAMAPTTKPTDYAGQVIVAEYSDPNPFKVLHAGHLYTTLVGDAVSRLMEVAGGEVHRANFGGDVGLHVARTMWGLAHSQDFNGDEDRTWNFMAEHEADPLDDRMKLIASCYVAGNTAYETDEQAKAEIVQMNKRVYQVHAQNDHESPFAQIYWTGRQWSYDYFENLYKQLQVAPFEKYYPESATTPLGLQTVREQLEKGVYEHSNGAIVFNGEKYGLHTRVFINSEGLPTYEAKDVGLIMTKWQDYHFDRSLIITANDIVEYMKVVLKSIEQFEPELAARTTHLTHGVIKLQGGVKMSSRKGNGLLAQDVLDAATAANREATGADKPDTVLGAVKYAFLKQRIGADIIYDPQESVSLEGNSGPYLQYAHARARSILSKTSGRPAEDITVFEGNERSLARKIAEYPEVVQKAAAELRPHHICTYLYELAQTFNRFYEHNRVIGDAREAERLRLVTLYADVLKDGLGVLGIAAPDHM